MASGYVTSDGKDLDSRYLGISAKAASAKTADSAGTLTGALRVLPNGKNIMVAKSVAAQKTASYSITTDALVQRTDQFGSASIVVNGNTLGSGEICFASKGTSATFKNNYTNSNTISIELLVCPVIAKS